MQEDTVQDKTPLVNGDDIYVRSYLRRKLAYLSVYTECRLVNLKRWSICKKKRVAGDMEGEGVAKKVCHVGQGSEESAIEATVTIEKAGLPGQLRRDK